VLIGKISDSLPVSQDPKKPVCLMIGM